MAETMDKPVIIEDEVLNEENCTSNLAIETIEAAIEDIAETMQNIVGIIESACESENEIQLEGDDECSTKISDMLNHARELSEEIRSVEKELSRTNSEQNEEVDEVPAMISPNIIAGIEALVEDTDDPDAPTSLTSKENFSFHSSYPYALSPRGITNDSVWNLFG